MSNYLAIATVTSALKNIIQAGIGKDLPGTLVTTFRPDTIATAQKERKVNVYMYQATPNKEFNSSNSSSYKLNKGITKGKAVCLDLYYIISFYGNEQELETQQLLGSTIKALVDRPTLNAEVIEDTLFQAKFLDNSTLGDQIQQIKFAPAMIEADGIVRIWSAMFQSPYTLSIIYQGKAVLIQGEKLGKSPLPIRERQLALSSTAPKIDNITVERGNKRAITRKSTLLIQGEQLNHSLVKVKIGEGILTPQQIGDQEIKLILSEQSSNLRPGTQNLQIIHYQSEQKNDFTTTPAIKSNKIKLVLRPTILRTTILNLTKNWQQQCSGQIQIDVDLLVSPKQKVYLILNEINNTNSEDYIFVAQKPNGTKQSLWFAINGIKAASYLVRIKIDNAESLLEIDPITEEYCQPVIHLESKNTIKSAKTKQSKLNSQVNRNKQTSHKKSNFGLKYYNSINNKKPNRSNNSK